MTDENAKTPPDANSSPQEEPTKALGKEEKLENELKECKDKYLRLLAEMENSRKRLQKEKQEMMRFSVENVISEFLTPMDNLENALKFTENMSEETKHWAKGFEMILAQFKDVLSNHGVTVFQSAGAHFDPHMHEAVEIEETEKFPPGTIIHEYVKGYKSSNRTIRPARVKVAKIPTVLQEEPKTPEA